MVISLLSAQAANGSGAAHAHTGRRAVVAIWGELSAGTVTLEMRTAAGNWLPLSGGSFTAAGASVLELPRCHIRATLSGAGATPAPSVNVELRVED